MPSPKDPFVAIAEAQLATIAGGASRTSSDAQLTQMLTQITSSIKDLASQQNKGTDPMQLMLMMLMLDRGGGGNVVAAAPTVVDVAVRGCGPRGRKGW